MQITIRSANRGPKPYVALIVGTHPQYKFNRQFLTLAQAGNKLNCYEDLRTVEDVAPGSVVQVRTSNYKGAATSQFLRINADGTTSEITEAEVYAALS